jgi:hypothetical protein
MTTSNALEIKNILHMNSKKVFLLLSTLFVLFSTLEAQPPTWFPGTPSIASTGPLSITVNYGINKVGIVYIVVFNFDNATAYNSNDIKTLAQTPPAGSKVAVAVLNVAAGDINKNLQRTLDVINVSRLHSVFLVAEGTPGGLQAAPVKLLATTLACPPIKLQTYFGNSGECVTDPASGIYAPSPILVPPTPTGVLKGTTWRVVWGDGSPDFLYTSSADGDIPAPQTHIYPMTTNCVYQGQWVVRNPCNEFLAGSNIFVVHGREVPSDGDGLLQMEESVKHDPDITYVCEGKQVNIRLRDISTWNCQNPVVPIPLNPADYDNDKPRNIQFIYGEHPVTGVVGPNNTITGNVIIGGVNIANAANGYDNAPVITNINPPNPNTLTDIITIPATAVAGQRFYVYIKNWNKCNLYTGNPAIGYVYEDFIIEIIDSPPPPIVVTPKNYCVGSVPATISATPNLVGNTINWYADAGLTTLLFTGQNYTHGKTTAGNYNYWVTETNGSNACEGPPAQITMNIYNVIANNIVASPQTICYNTVPAGLTGTIPTGGTGAYTYQWQGSADNVIFNNIAGATNQNYFPPALTSTTYYRRIITSGPCSHISNSIQITVYAQLIAGTIGNAQSICYNTAPSTLNQATAPTGGTGVYTYQWQISTDNIVFNNIAGATASSYSPPALTANRYYRRNVTSGTCGTASSPSILITVYPDVTPGTVSAPQTICYNTVPAMLTGTAPTGGDGTFSYRWQSSPDNSTWSNIAGATVSTYTPPALTTSTYYRRRVQSAGCTFVYSNSILITVYAQLTAGTVGTDQSICPVAVPAALTQLTAPTGGTGVYTYQWQDSPDNITFNNIVGATGVAYAPPALGATRYFRRRVTSGACGTVTTNTVTITVGSSPTNATFTGNGPLCFGASGTLTSVITGGAPSYTLTITGYGVAGGYTSGSPINLGVQPPGTYNYTLTSVVDACGTVLGAGLPKNYSLVVYDNLTPGTIGTAQSICYNTIPAPLTELTVPTGGPGGYTYQWQSSPDNATWTSIGGATGVGYAPPALTANTYYRRRVTSGTCGTVSSGSILITVYANLTSGTIGSAQSVCYNTIPAALTQLTAPTGGPGGYTYQWQSSPDNSTWTNIGGATAVGYAPPALTASTYYRRQVTSGACAPVYSASILKTVYGQLTAGSIGNAQSICYNTMPTGLTQLSAPIGGTGTYSYQWQNSLDNVTWGNIAGATGVNYNPPALTVNTYYRRQVIDALCGWINSNSILITVYGNLTPGTIGSAQSICYNTIPAALTQLTAPSGGPGGYIYQWQSSPDNATWTSIGGATGVGYAPPALTASTYYRRQVTSGTCTTVSSGSILITVYGNLTAGTIGTAQAICYNTVPAPLTELTAPTGGPGGYTYQWQSSPDNATWTSIGGATGVGYAPPALTASTYYRRLVTSGTCTVVSSGSILITVYANFTPGTIGTAQSICYNTIPAALTQLTAPTGGPGGYTYQWQSSPDNATWTSIVGATGVSYAPPALTASTYYRRNVTSGTCGTVSSASVLITVYPVLAGGTIANDQTICSGGDVAAFTSTMAASGGAGIFTYTWQWTTNLAAVPGDANWTDIPASNSLTWDYGTLVTTTRFIRKGVEGTCSTPVYSNILLITVRPALDGGAIGSNQTICSGTDVAAFTNLISPSGGDNTFTYTWQYTTNMAAVPGDANWTDIPGSNVLAYDYGNLTVQTKFVRKATDISCSSPVYSNVLTININPLPVTGPITGDAILCNTATNKVYSVTGTAGSTYTWTVPGGLLTKTVDLNTTFIIVDAVPASSGSGNIQVTEKLALTGCVGLPVTFGVTVTPVSPGVVVSGPASVCQGATGVQYSVPFNAGSTYSWIVPAGASITSDPTKNIIDVTFTMAGSGQVSVVENTSGVCTTIHLPLPVTINPLPTVYNVTAPAGYCAGDPGVTVTLSNSQTGVNYQLYKDAVADGAPLPGNTGSALTWANRLTGTYTVVATNATTGCTQPMSGNPTPVINAVNGGTIGTDQTICEGTPPAAFTSIAPGIGAGTITYQWQISTDGGATYTDILGATSAVYTSGALINDTRFRRMSVSTLGSSVCQSPSNEVIVTVNNFDPGGIAAAQTICENTPPAAFTSTTPTGDGLFTYQWKFSTDGISYSNIAGANSETFTSTPLLVDTWFKREVTSTLNTKACVEETAAIKVTVINFTPGTISMDQTICEATAPAVLTGTVATGDGTFSYQWQESLNGTVFTDIAVGANGVNYTPPALSVDTWYRRKAISNVLATCEQISNVVKITINIFDPGSIAADQTICEGDVPAAFTSVDATGVAGAVFAYQWQFSTDNITYSNIPGATSNIYASPALTADGWFKRRVISSLNSNTCTEFTLPVKVTVNNFLPGSIGSDQTICDGEVPAALTSVAPSGDGTFTYQWQSSTDGIAFANIAGETNATYAPPALTQDTWYKRLVTSTLPGKDCIEETNVVKITVINFVPGSIGSDQTICDNTAPASLTSVTPTGDGVFTYQWYSSADGVTYNIIGGATSETYNPGLLTADTWYRRNVTSTLNGKSCMQQTNAVRITVINFLPGSIGSDQTICEGDIPAPLTSVLPSGDGAFTYQWKESSDGIVFTDIAGATLDTYTPGALIADTWYKRVVTSTLNAKLCIEETNIIKITVINFLPGTISADQTICESTAPAAFTASAATGDGTKSYQWQDSPDGVTFTDIAGATNPTFTGPVLVADRWYRRAATATVGLKSCTLYSNSVKITINIFDPGSVAADQTICEGDVPAPFTAVAPTGVAGATFLFQWQYSADGVSYSNIPGATASTYASTALSADGWFRRGVVATLNSNTCLEYTLPVKVTVNNFVPGSIGSAQTICEGTIPVALTSVAASGDGTIAYQWQSSTDGISFGDIAGETNATYAPPALAQDTWYKRLATSTLLGKDCTEESNVVKITVNNMTPGSIGSDQTICENTAPAPLTSVAPTADGTVTYKWYSSPDGTTFTVIAGAISETYNPGLLSADTWYRRDVTSTLNGNNCTESTNVIRITVNNFLPGSIGSDQTICEGLVPAALTSVLPTGDGAFTYQWMESTDGITFANIAGATLATYAPAALTQDTWYKRVVTSTLNLTACVEETNIVRITVINFVPGTIGTDQTICENTAPVAFTSVLASGDGVKTYQWQSSTDNVTYNNIVGATSATYTSPALTQDTWFKRLATATLNLVACTEESNVILVTVNNFDPGSISADQTICEGDVPIAFTSVTPTGDGAFTYQWQASLDGVSFSNITGATAETYASAALSADTWFRRAVTSTLNGNQCTENTVPVKVTVNNFTPGSISASQTICEGDIPAPLTSVAASGDGTIAYQWQNSTDGVSFADIAGETNAAYAPPALTQDTWYKRLATSTLTGKDCTEESNVVRITVNNFDPGSIGSDQTICENTAPAPLTSVTPTGDGIFTYKWYSSPDGATFTVIAGAISETYSPGLLTADTWYRREVTSTLNGKPCTEITNVVRITVNNFLPGSIGSDQTICEGVVPAALTSVTPTGDGAFTYQWKESTDGIVFTDIVGATSETFAPAALIADTWYKRSVTSTLNAMTCVEETNVVRITVINFVPGSIGNDQTICESTTPVAFTSVPATGDGVKTYQWQSSTDNITFNNIGGATAATYTSTPLSVDTWFKRLATSTLNAVACTEESNVILVTVNNFDPGSIAADQTICEGDLPVAFTSVTPTGDGTFTYQWQSSTDGVGFISIAGATSETYASAALTQDTWFRRQVTSTLNGNQCVENTLPVKVTVNNFVPGSIGSNQTICEGDVPLALTSVAPTGDGTFAFQWQFSIDGTTFNNVVGATAATYAPAALTQDTWYKRLVTSTLLGKDCTEETNVVKITVNNFDPGSIGSDQTICENTAPAPLSSVSPTGDGVFTYKWYSSPDGATFTVIAGAVSETYNPGLLAADTWFRREVTSNLNSTACTEITNVVKITVNNFIPGSIGSDQTICDGATPAALTSVTPTGDGAFTYQWRQSLDGTVFTDIAGATNETYAPPALNADTWYKRVVTSTLNAVPCVEETNVVRVTVINFAPGSINADQTICEATIPATFTGVAPTGDGTFTFQWQNSLDGTTFANIPGATNATYTSVALSVDTWFRRVVTSTLNLTSCTQNTNIIKVTVNHLDPGTIGSDQTICENTVPAAFTGSVPTGDGVLTFQWQSSLDGISYTNITGATGSNYTSTALTQDTWFKRQVVSTLNGNTCAEESPAIKVTVNNITPGSISTDQTVCNGDVPAALVVVAPVADGTVTYQWQNSIDGTNFNNIPGETNANLTMVALTQDTWYKRLETSTIGTNTCTKESNTIKITVNNFIPGSIGSDQTICENTAPAPLTSVTPTGDGIFTYQWSSSPDGLTFTPILGAINETYNPGPLLVDTWYRREVTSTLNGKSCKANTNVVMITVINFVQGSISADQTICENVVPAPLTSVAPTGDGVFTYQWRSSLDGVNFTSIAGANGATFAPAALTQDTWYKLLVTSALNGTQCVKETNFVKITVNNVTGGTIISDQAICSGADPVPFMSTVPGLGDGAMTYQWQLSLDGLTYTDIPGATAMVYDSPALNQDTWFKRITNSLLNTVLCTKESNVVKVTVNVVNGGTIAADQTICYGTAPVPFTSTSDGAGSGLVSYQWYLSTNGVIFSTIPGATANTYTSGPLMVETYFKRVLTSNLGGNICNAESNVIKVSINPLPIGILTGGETICPGATANLNVNLPIGTGPFELDIQNYPGLTVTNYTSDANIPVSPLVTTTYKVLRIRDANGCQVVSPSANIMGSATITVRALPAITVSPVNKTTCEFGMVTFNVTATGSDLTYQWYVNDGTTTTAITDGGVYFGAQTAALMLFGSTRDMNGYTYYAEVTGCSTTVTSGSAILTVNTAPEIITQPRDSTICLGDGAAFMVTAQGTGITYQWEVKKGALPFAPVSNDANFSGATTPTLTIVNTTASFNNNIFRVKISGTCGIPVYSNFVVLRLNLPPTVTVNPTSKAICENGGPIFFVGNGSGVIDSLRWQVSTNAGVTWTDIYDNAFYSGTTSQQLSVVNVPVTYNNNQYRLALKAFCTTVYTNAATLTVNANPIVDFSAVTPINACGNIPIVINGNPTSGSGTYTQHIWTGDIGPLDNYFIQAPTFKSNIPGTYNLNYQVRDSKGCTANNDLQVIVDAPDATFTSDVFNGCTPLTVNFSKDMTGISKFWWNFGDGSPKDSVNASPTHIFTNVSPSTIGYYDVELKVMSGGGCYATYKSTITVYPEIDASFTSNKTVVCSGGSITFNALPGANKYFWEYGDGASGYGSNVTTHLYTNPGPNPAVLTVKLTTTSFYNCINTQTMTITVMPVPIPQFTANPVTQYYNMAGNPVTFTNATNPGTWTWLWKFGDNSTSTVQDPVHTYIALGDFDVWLIVSNANCKDSVKHTVSVRPQPPIANFDSIPSGCAPLEMQLNNTSVNADAPGTKFLWDFGDGNTSTQKNPNYTYFTPGSYRVTLTVTGPYGDQDIKSQVVKAYVTPKSYFEVTPTFVYVNDEKVRCFNLSQNADYYIWEFGDGDTSHVKDPFHKYLTEGVYDITLHAYSYNGCMNSWTLSPGVTVEPAGVLRFSTVFAPNKEGPIERSDLPTGGQEIDQFFFPPIREKVLNYKLQIFNRWGTLIFESRDINVPWNGYYKGKLCKQGVYVWIVEGKYANGKPFKQTGDVTLLH